MVNNQNTISTGLNAKEKLKNISCEVPYRDLQIYEEGNISNCCFTWMPKTIGNINKNSLLEILTSLEAREAKASVTDGTFKFCDAELCPKLAQYLNQDKIEHPLFAGASQFADEISQPSKQEPIRIFFNYDKSCNLSCPSCRNEKILFKLNDLPVNLMKTHHAAVTSIDELLKKGFKVSVNVTGSGDPFASPLYWDYLKNLDYNENLTIRLQTNGVLMTPERLLPNLKKMISFVNISVDASSEATYNIVRRGGSLKSVQNNIEKFDQAILNGDFPKLEGWQSNFIVQKDNFHEMSSFAKWALQFKSMTVIWYNLIADWGHLTSSEFSEKAIWSESHPLHSEFLAELAKPELKNERIMLGNLSNYLNSKKIKP